MTDDVVTDDDLAVGDARAQAIDEALATTEDDLDDTSTALVTANGAVAMFAQVVEALRAVSFLDLDTPDQRRLAVMLYERLGPIEEIAAGHRRMIEAQFKRMLVDEGATRISLGDDRFVGYVPPPTSYRVREQALYEGLRELVDAGVVTERQVEEAIHPETYYKVNHTKLNGLHRNMGTRVAAVIDENRVAEQPDPNRGRVSMPKAVR